MSPSAVPSGDVGLFEPKLMKIDVMNADAFLAELLTLSGKTRRLVLDLSRVAFIDSSGLGKIVTALRTIRDSGGEMRICGVQAPVQILFAMVRLEEIVGIDPDAETARQSLGGSSAVPREPC